MGAVIVSVVVAEHELAAEFNRSLQAVVEQRAQVIAKLEAEADRAFKSLELVFSFEAKEASQEIGLDHQAKQGVRIIRKWTNKHAFDLLARRYGKTKMPKHDVTSYSQVYYRVNGVLVASGHGESMLTVNLPCSDAEWQLIQAGNVPSKFL